MHVFWIVCACLVQSGAYPKNNGRPSRPVDLLPQVDALGPFTQLIDNVLSQLTGKMPTPMDYECTAQSLFVGGNDLKLIQRPFGYCPYCCPIKSFADHVHLYFTNKKMARNPVELKIAQKSGALRSAGVNSTLTTIMFIHGFTENGNGTSANTIRDAYLTRKEDYNIILVDWRDLSAAPWYKQAVDNVKIVGMYLGKVIKFFNKTGELSISKLHLIGFSLGGHIAGFIGKSLKSIQKVPRITALDPAFPLFPLEDPSQRISKADAEFIDVIHTDGGVLGYPMPVGHADFYPNGGRLLQPGCEVSKLIERQYVEDLVFCSHLRAWSFYAESVTNPSAFPATKCGIMRKGSAEQCRFIVHGYMGFRASKNSTLGNFYLTTNDHSPFSKSAKEQELDMNEINLIL